MTEDQRSQERVCNSQRHRNIRENMPEEQRSQERLNSVHRMRNLRIRHRNLRVAAQESFNETTVLTHHCGQLDTVCDHCDAMHFAAELPSDKQFTQCCQKGKVQLLIEPIETEPLLQQLLTFQHPHSEHFHENIRSINSALAFASLGANIAPPPGYGPYCFRINGQIYHRAGALHPINDDQRKFAQLYILDPDEAAKQRLLINSQFNPDLITALSRCPPLIRLQLLAKCYLKLNKSAFEMQNHMAFSPQLWQWQ